MGLLTNAGLLLPGIKTVKATEMMDIILCIRHVDRIRRDFLQADLTVNHRAAVFVGTLRNPRARRGAMPGIHGAFPKRMDTP